MSLSLRQLDLFRLLMQTRNVTEAARLLNISQPSASQTLKDLEYRLGLELFHRRGGRINPTAEARQLLPDVDRLLSQMDTLENRTAELKDARAGQLSIATIAVMTGVILPAALARFLKERPLVQLKVTALGAHEAIRQVVQENADIGFVFAPIDDPQVAAEPLLRSQMVCLMAADHRLAAQPVVRLRDLLDETMIVLDPTTPPGPQLHEALAGIGRRTRPPIEINLTSGAVSMVKNRLGVLVVDPLILLSELTAGLVMRPFEITVPITVVAIFPRHRPMSRVTVRFFKTLREEVAAAAARLQGLGVSAEDF